MASFLPFKIYSERQTRKRKTESCLLSLLSTRLSLPSARFSFPTQPPFPSEMPSVSYLPSAAPSTKFYHFFPSWFRMPQHHFNLFLWALVFNLFPNLISDPSSLKWKKKKMAKRDYITWQSLLAGESKWSEKTVLSCLSVMPWACHGEKGFSHWPKSQHQLMLKPPLLCPTFLKQLLKQFVNCGTWKEHRSWSQTGPEPEAAPAWPGGLGYAALLLLVSASSSVSWDWSWDSPHK